MILKEGFSSGVCNKILGQVGMSFYQNPAGIRATDKKYYDRANNKYIMSKIYNILIKVYKKVLCY